ncbi:MAG: YCF48-related protein [Pyrinomonadaceae bacterium]
MDKTIVFRKALVLIFAAAMLNISGLAATATDTSPAAPAFSDWQVVGPTGGDVRVVAIDPRDKDRLYMSTLDGQIHTSSNGGASWRLLVNLDQPELILDQLFVDARDSKIIYTSGHRHKAPGGFFRTTDGGATWKESKELRKESIHSMTQSVKDPSILLVGTTAGVWMSRNSGADWEKISSSTMPVNIDSLVMDPRSTDVMYAGTWWRAYKSTDAGKNWRLIKNGMIDDSDVFAVTLDPRNPEHVIASACSGIYESSNGGERWAKIQGIPSQSRRTRDILQHPTLPGVVYAGTTEGFWMTTNGGKSWALTTQRNLEINSIAVHQDEPNRVFIGTNNYGLMVSNDGGRNFVQTNGNFSSRLTYFVTPDLQQHNRLYAATHNTATGGGYFFVSSDEGRTWTPGRNLDTARLRPFALKQDPSNPNLLYLGTNLGIYRSLDRGNSWSALPAAKIVKAPAKSTRRTVKRPVKKPVAKKTVKKTASVVAKNAPPAVTTLVPQPVPAALISELKEKVKVIEIVPDDKGTLLVGTDNGVYRGSDLTKGWEKLNLPAGMDDNIFAIHVAAARPETIWVGTATSGVLVSYDNGATWARTGGAVNNVPVSSIASDPMRPDYIYVGTTQTFYLSRDNGQTWSRRGGNLSLGNFTSILINPTNTDEIILSSALDTEGGLYISTDAGSKWKRVDTREMKLASHRFWALAFDPQDPNRMFAATHSSGVYRIERSSIVSEK